jgi:hypothetical protein
MKRTVRGMFNNKGELTVDLNKLGLEQYKKYKIIIKEINPMLTFIKTALSLIAVLFILFLFLALLCKKPVIQVSDQDIRIDEMFNTNNSVEFRENMFLLVVSHAEFQNRCALGLRLGIVNNRIDIAKKECQ